MPATASADPFVPERGVIWKRRAQVDRKALLGLTGEAGTAGGRLGFAPESGPGYQIQIQSVDGAVSGRWLAKGAVEGVAESRALFLVRAGEFAGTVRIPGDGIYVMQGPVDGDCVVRKLDPLQIPRCGVTDMSFQNAALEKFKAIEAAAAERGDSTAVQPELVEKHPDKELQPEIRPLATSTLDMMVVYTAASRAGAGGKEAIETLIELAVIEANDCFANSQVNLQLNLIHTREMAYNETGDMQLDLYNLAFGLGGLGEVDNLRTIQFKADLVCMITEREDTGYIAGIAYLVQTPSGNSTYPSYSVVRRA